MICVRVFVWVCVWERKRERVSVSVLPKREHEVEENEDVLNFRELNIVLPVYIF